MVTNRNESQSLVLM